MPRWMIWTLLAMLGAGGGLALAWPLMAPRPPRDVAKIYVRPMPAHTDHAPLINGPFADGPAVTKACLSCHKNAAHELMATSHWTWLGQAVRVPGHEQPVRIGKANLINNFCIGVQPNLARCTSCHAGYGWVDQTFDFTKQDNVDCLICHDSSGQYRKDPAKGGIVAAGVDLVAAARSVAMPTRRNCGMCHFAGGGGDAVKHGDLDGTMYFPTERIDVHMGRFNFACQECHRTNSHDVAGRSMSVSVDDTKRVACTDCHSPQPHQQERLNQHTKTLACQTCHIPKMAIDAPTKMSWDWSTAGKDIPNADPHQYMKTKGHFVYAKDVDPEYYWYNGTAERYLLGDKIDPAKTTHINYPGGDVHDHRARIWPFKVHRGKQPYDAGRNELLSPSTAGKGGYWDLFNWNKAAELGAKASGMSYSGRMGFAATDMYWPLSHMVATKDKALQCNDCHSEGGRMKWKDLGYDGDPAFRGGRVVTGLTDAKGGRQ